MKKIIVTGSNGLLGQKLIYLLLSKGNYEIHAVARGENRITRKDGYTYHNIDITNKESIQQLISAIQPDIFINPAAMTNVDACEKDKEGCRAANVFAVEYMVEALEKIQTENFHPHFIHFSTDFIFDGENGPYKETDEPNPLSFYAQSKLDSEKVVLNSQLKKQAIVRTIIIYGLTDGNQRSNLVLWVKNSLTNGQSINVINDQFRSPTLAEDLAVGTLAIAEKNKTGIYHLSGPETYSIWTLAEMVADYYHLDKSFMKPVTSAELNQPAKRPPVTGFILDKAKKDLDYNPRTFLEGIKFLDNQLKQIS